MIFDLWLVSYVYDKSYPLQQLYMHNTSQPWTNLSNSDSRAALLH